MTSKRDISASNESAILDSVVRPIVFARLDFSSGVQRFHTQIGPRTATHPVHGSETYTGVGDFGGLGGEVIESASTGEQRVDLFLSGVNASLVNISLVDDYYRRDAEIMLGFDNASGSLVDNPVILFSGFMEKVDVNLSQGIGQLRLRLESRATNLNRASDLRFTDEDKQRETSGDVFGEYIYRMADLELFWGDRSFFVNLGGPREGKRRSIGPNRGRG